MLEFCYFCRKLTLDNVQWGMIFSSSPKFPIVFPNRSVQIFWIPNEYTTGRHGDITHHTNKIIQRDKTGFKLEDCSKATWWIAIGN